eukprot:7365940-Ditylum_brightwellii.AAC.1
MPLKTSYSKKSIYFNISVGNKYTKIICPASMVYNGEDKIDYDKLKTYFENVFTSCSEQLNLSNIISNDILTAITEDYNSKNCIKTIYIQDCKDESHEEYTLYNGSFIHYINQMIDLSTDIKVKMTKDHDNRQIKQQPKDIKPSTIIDKGYYKESE